MIRPVTSPETPPGRRRAPAARAAACAALVALPGLAACAGRGGIPADAAPAAPSAARPAGAEPLTPGIVPLTVEQEREVE